MGYSWGGGVAHDLIERLSQNEGMKWTPFFGPVDMLMQEGFGCR